MNVVEEVVAKNWCIGCGMCAAVCSEKHLEIRWNDRGEYVPVEIEESGKCSARCSVCYRICPAHGYTKNATEIGRCRYGGVEGIQHRDETGYFLSSYVGYSERHRARGASGGMATWMLEKLMETGEVDAVAAVSAGSDPDRLFEFKICWTPEEIRGCSRSSYYPVEVSQVIQYILTNSGRYAVIGLPCVCKAVRLAQDVMPKLRRRIKFLLGLSCGHQCSRFFAEYICALGGGRPSELKEIIFRTKDFSELASNIGFEFRSGEGADEISGQVLWYDGVNIVYENGYFQLPGCFHCDDVFAECADVVFMDAWLPEYVTDPKGTSLVIVRRPELDALLCANPNISGIEINRVIESQRAALKRKRTRLFRIDSPPIREFRKKSFIIDRLIETQKLKLCFQSGKCWDGDIVEFEKKIKSYRKPIDQLNALCKLVLGSFKFVAIFLSRFR